MTTQLHTFSDTTVDALQGLIGVNLDSAEGFRAAAETVHEPRLSALFSDIGGIRAQFARQLQQLVASDEKPTTTGTVIGTAHRWWLKVRGAWSDDNAYAVLAEAERAEDRIVGLYEDAMRDCGEPEALGLLKQQFIQIKADHDRVRDLRDAYQQST